MSEFLIRCFVKNKDNVKDPAVRRRYGRLTGITGIICNLILFGIKFAAGIMTGAVSILADAFNNLADSASSIVTMIGFKIAGIPEDEQHPYGHGRVEYLSGLVISTAILLTGFELLKVSIHKIRYPEVVEMSLFSVLVLILSIVLKMWLAAFNKKIGDRIQSEAMKATAADSLSDCISTLAVLAGIGITWISGRNLDGWFGVIVAVFVCMAGLNSAKDTIQPLLGQAPDPEMICQIRELVLKDKRILGVHGLCVHDYGPGRKMISLHAEVAGTEDLLTAHEIADHAERRLKRQFDCEAIIHIDPIVYDDPQLNEVRRLVEKMVHCRNELWTIHDLKIVREGNVTQVVFDLVVTPEELGRKEEIEEQIRHDILRIDPGLMIFVRVEQDFI